MPRPWLIAVAALLGCSSADFEVASSSDVGSVETEVPVTDTSTAGSDTSVVVDSSVRPDTTGPEACPPNACSGCGDLEKAPGTPCGLCMTSSIVCASPATVKCAQPDDRKESKDDYFKGFDGTGLTLASPQSVAIAFKLARTGSPISLTLAMQRYDVSSSAAVGNLQVRLIQGTPTLTPSASAVLSTSLIAATLIPSSPDNVVVVLSGIPPLAKDTPLWIEITDHSELANFAVNGASGSSTDLRFYFSSGSGYTEKLAVDPYLVVGMKSCF